MDLPNKVTCEVKLRFWDVFDPFAYTWANTFRWALLIFACVLIYQTKSLYVESDASSPDDWQVLLTVYLLISFTFLALFIFPYFRLLSMFRKAPYLKKPRQMTLDAEGMHIESDDARGDVKWSLFQSVVEMNKVFIFMPSGWQGTYLPKRCLKGPEDIALIRQLIRENFKGTKHLRSD